MHSYRTIAMTVCLYLRLGPPKRCFRILTCLLLRTIPEEEGTQLVLTIELSHCETCFSWSVTARKLNQGADGGENDNDNDEDAIELQKRLVAIRGGDAAALTKQVAVTKAPKRTAASRKRGNASEAPAANDEENDCEVDSAPAPAKKRAKANASSSSGDISAATRSVTAPAVLQKQTTSKATTGGSRLSSSSTGAGRTSTSGLDVLLQAVSNTSRASTTSSEFPMLFSVVDTTNITDTVPLVPNKTGRSGRSGKGGSRSGNATDSLLM